MGAFFKEQTLFSTIGKAIVKPYLSTYSDCNMRTKSVKKHSSKVHPRVCVEMADSNLKDLSDSPFFLEKDIRARETIRKYGLPIER